MASERTETVLVTGGSGYLGGWCLVEVLRRGYRARTTLRSRAREGEVRDALGRQVDVGDRLEVFEADLRADAGWEEAVSGADHVLHVASPFPPETPDDPNELIVPAREGALRVLRAGLAAGVKRVVMTSSVAAVSHAPEPRPNPLTEDCWTDVDDPGARAYVQSKTLAEQAAWDLVRERGAEDRLATIQPGAIIGPALTPDLSYSLQTVERLLNRRMPGIPNLGFSFVDVRDVADLHMRAMTNPEAGGKRFIAVTQFLWLSDVARILRERLGPAGARVPKRKVPNFVVRGVAMFDPSVRQIVGDLGRHTKFSNDRARSTLGWSPRPIEETIVDCGQSLIDLGVVEAAAA